MNRKAISKSVRFSVFARDGFTCRYCGRQSDRVVLEIDHVIPHAVGGSDEVENLLTSCFECNRGKGVKTLDSFVPTEEDRLRLSQERNEQKLVAEAAMESVLARQQTRQIISDFWMSLTGRSYADDTTIAIMCSFVQRHGVKLVMEWIEIAHSRLGRKPKDKDLGKYISGIRRKYMKDQTDNP